MSLVVLNLCHFFQGMYVKRNILKAFKTWFLGSLERKLYSVKYHSGQEGESNDLACKCECALASGLLIVSLVAYTSRNKL